MGTSRESACVRFGHRRRVGPWHGERHPGLRDRHHRGAGQSAAADHVDTADDGDDGQPYACTDVEAEDPDAGATLTFSLIQPPQGMTIHASTGVIAWTPGTTQTGPFAVTVRVTDGTDAAQQAYELTVAAAAPENRPPAAHAGGPYQGEAGIAVAFDGTQSSDSDGDALSFSWSFGDGSAAASGASPSHVFTEAGSFVVTLTVSDGHGGESVRTTTAAIGAAGDRAPPAVTLLGPREVLPGDQVTLTAQATDNVKVDKVTFTVDGGAPSEATTEPFQRSIAVPPVASPGTEIEVAATATDPSGNAGSAEATLTIKAKPDTETPGRHAERAAAGSCRARRYTYRPAPRTTRVSSRSRSRSTAPLWRPGPVRPTRPL